MTDDTKLFDAERATEVVVGRMGPDTSPRLREVMTAVTRHLHELVRELRPTEAEWAAAVAFLTETGQISDDKRKEFVLLSDVLGVSMLVDALGNPKPDGATESTVLGPFHVAGAPEMDHGGCIAQQEGGEPLVVEGRVTDLDGAPIANATLDIWQTDHEGFYDVQRPQPGMDLRGRFRTGEDGRYRFRTVKPVSYPIPDDGPVGKLLRAMGRHPYRPAHIHLIAEAPGFETVVTHFFTAGDPYLESDAVFGVKPSLVVSPSHVEDAAESARVGEPGPFWHVARDVVLVPAGSA